MNPTREQRTEKALFRGSRLTLEDARYCETVQALTELLLKEDLSPADVTVKALGLRERAARAAIIAQRGGVVAGLAELRFFFERSGIAVKALKQDGDLIAPDDVLLELEGGEAKLLTLERVGLNLIQRMSGIATTARCVQERAWQRGSRARIIGTRKTLWGLIDKRALHLGGAGTHRLGLGDAILIKNNHLALLAQSEKEAVPIAIERAWRFRGEAAFIEVEVRSEDSARAAAETFRRLLEEAAQEYPCLLLLDNMTPVRLRGVVELLQREKLWDHVLLEASGGISEANAEAYAATGVDAISIGALTHSARALDICLRFS